MTLDANALQYARELTYAELEKDAGLGDSVARIANKVRSAVTGVTPRTAAQIQATSIAKARGAVAAPKLTAAPVVKEAPEAFAARTTFPRGQVGGAPSAVPTQGSAALSAAPAGTAATAGSKVMAGLKSLKPSHAAVGGAALATGAVGGYVMGSSGQQKAASGFSDEHVQRVLPSFMAHEKVREQWNAGKASDDDLNIAGAQFMEHLRVLDNHGVDANALLQHMNKTYAYEKRKAASVEEMYEAHLAKGANRQLPWELDHPYVNEIGHGIVGGLGGAVAGGAVGAIGGPVGALLGVEAGASLGSLAGAGKAIYDHHQAAVADERAHGPLPFIVRHPYLTNYAANLVAPGVGGIGAVFGHLYQKDQHTRPQPMALKAAYEQRCAELEKEARGILAGGLNRAMAFAKGMTAPGGGGLISSPVSRAMSAAHGSPTAGLPAAGSSKPGFFGKPFGNTQLTRGHLAGAGVGLAGAGAAGYALGGSSAQQNPNDQYQPIQ